MNFRQDGWATRRYVLHVAGANSCCSRFYGEITINGRARTAG
ncbi:hypothetical protein [Amycolatopsis sp. FBCC-B4732]|nr:hypothetical protein [Amycolatopsis sp. FBCC-B4732]